MSRRPEQEPRQLVLDLAHRTALAAEDFLVSGSNEAAVAIIDSWPEWPGRAIVVAGPAGSGKSHLVSVWRQRSAAGSVAARDLSLEAIESLAAAGALAVEDIDRGIGSEQALFHLLNLSREQRLFLLLTSRLAPGAIEIALPDLRSRLRALPVASILAPDQALLRALLVKLFADRQLSVEPHVIEHIALHMERSTEAASAVVGEIDTLALATRRKVTRALAADAMQRVEDRRAAT